jgi:RNA polymerase-binding transcription factor
MTAKASAQDANFLSAQRESLSRLREALLATARADEADEADVRSESAASGSREYEDDAQKLAALELDGNRVVRDIARLERVERALRKIEEGTYGVSDLSGNPIPKERLMAVPEAICLAEEERAFESQKRG